MTRTEQLKALRADVDALAHADEATILASLIWNDRQIKVKKFNKISRQSRDSDFD